jgi:hypothetical protein
MKETNPVVRISIVACVAAVHACLKIESLTGDALETLRAVFVLQGSMSEFDQNSAAVLATSAVAYSRQ